jgi:phospholipid N-methyltransferase
MGAASVLLLDGMLSAGLSCARALRNAAADFQRSAAGIFLREFAAQPRTVGAVWPSSSRLARDMASSVPLSGSGLVVELGAGTGTVTKALLDNGVSVDRLRVVEQCPVFVHHLRQRYPFMDVIQGDAAMLDDLLHDDTPVTTIVSSLPLRSLAHETVSTIIEQWRKVLPLGGRVVQFTYAPTSGLAEPIPGFVEYESHIIWGNFPPAKVMVFIRTV